MAERGQKVQLPKEVLKIHHFNLHPTGGHIPNNKEQYYSHFSTLWLPFHLRFFYSPALESGYTFPAQKG